MERHFFVTIFAPNKSAFADLQRLNLDIFGGSSRGELAIGGLLTETNIKQVRRAGYRVEIHEEYIEQGRQAGLARDAGGSSKQSPPVEIMDDKAWLKEFKRRKKVK